MRDEDKKFTAWHEAGHALVNVVLKHTHPLHKVTIIPRGQSLGATMSLPKQDVLNRRRKEMLDMICCDDGRPDRGGNRFRGYFDWRGWRYSAGNAAGARDGFPMGHER